MKNMKEAVVSAIAIAVIGCLTAYALFLGNDGETVLLGVSAIAGLAGYQVGKRQPPKQP